MSATSNGCVPILDTKKISLAANIFLFTLLILLIPGNFKSGDLGKRETNIPLPSLKGGVILSYNYDPLRTSYSFMLVGSLVFT